MRYRFTGNETVFIPSLNRVLRPGDETETKERVIHRDLQEIAVKPERPAKED